MSRHRIVAAVAGTALAFVLAGAAFAYNTTVVESLTVSGPGVTIPCGAPATFTATALDAESHPIAGLSIQWSVTSTPAHADVINANPTVTNASGVATTTITFAAQPGSRTVTATAPTAETSAHAVVTPCEGGVEGATGTPVISLPRTSTLGPEVPSGEPPIGDVLAFMGVAVAAAVIVRRFTLVRR